MGQITSITEPMIRQVVQRRDDNFGNIVFIGTFEGPIDGFQASSSLRTGMSGLGQGWAPLIDVSFTGQRFIGVYRQAAGGFYDLQIRPTYRGQVGNAMTVFAVGVGEVFITAGQSNSTNAGLPTGYIPDIRVSAFNADTGLDPNFNGAFWQWGIDPQPVTDGTHGGSVWPTMATNLVYATGLPVGLYSVGRGGTDIGEWLPGNETFERLTYALEYFKLRGGVRAVLWDQGETDDDLHTDPTLYGAYLRAVIDLSRMVAGTPVKWMVAQATGAPGNDPPLQAALRQAQAGVTDGVLTFLGPDTDILGFEFRQSPPAGNTGHFNAEGIVLLGEYWGIDVFNTPGFLAPGFLPAQ